MKRLLSQGETLPMITVLLVLLWLVLIIVGPDVAYRVAAGGVR